MWAKDWRKIQKFWQLHSIAMPDEVAISIQLEKETLGRDQVDGYTRGLWCALSRLRRLVR